MIPIVDMIKTIISCIVIRSLIIKYAIMDVKNGFSKMRMTLEVDVNLKAMKISKWAQVVPTTLAMT